MKKILLLIVGIFSFYSVFANSEIKIMKPRPDVVITIKLNLHSKKQDCNAGLGFCKISINLSFEDNVSPGGQTITGKSFINSQNQLVINLTETDLKNYDNGTVLKYFKGRNSVYVDDNYELAGDVCAALGSKKPINIKEGNYNIIFDQGVYTILIPQ